MAALTSLFPFDTANMISAVNISDVEYQIRDYQSRNALSAALPVIDDLSSMVKGGVHYIGRTETELTDGATTNPIYIGTEQVTAIQGDMVSYQGMHDQTLEFIYNGSNWYELGSTGSLKALAFKDTASGKITPAGNITVVTAQINEDVDFSNASFTGTAMTAIGSFAGELVSPTGSFTGTSATITADVTNEDDTLTVQLSNATVNVITGFTHNAISKPANLDVSKNTDDITINIAGDTTDNVLKSATTSSITSVLTAWTGSTTTFNGTYKPEGTVYLTGVGISGGINYSDPVISSGIGTLGISGLESTHTLKSSGTVTVTTDNCKPIMSCNTPSISASSGTNNFLSTATVSNEVLSFGSGAALTEYSSKLSNNISSVITSWSGNPAFSGDTPAGSITTVGTLSGSPTAGIQTAGSASLTGMGLTGTATFDGTDKAVSTSGTPLGSPKSVALSYVKSVTSGTVGVSGSGIIGSGTLVIDVAYASGDSGTQATFTPQKGDVKATGTQTLTYSKAKSISTSYTPSGNISINSFTPAGSVTTELTPAGTISGTQTIMGQHTHTATFGGTEATVTVS